MATHARKPAQPTHVNEFSLGAVLLLFYGPDMVLLAFYMASLLEGNANFGLLGLLVGWSLSAMVIMLAYLIYLLSGWRGSRP